ncbi:MAG: DUF4911 domain-containing protein [Proteobacteria bacterium]|nr:DUF4911 domain-containing protein [Pseudomonadota bacterium]
MEITKRYYRVERKDISFLKFIFEAYDGIAVITTVDRPEGIIMFRIPPGCENDVDTVLQDLGKNMMIEEYIPDTNDEFVKSRNMLT